MPRPEHEQASTLVTQVAVALATRDMERVLRDLRRLQMSAPWARAARTAADALERLLTASEEVVTRVVPTSRRTFPEKVAEQALFQLRMGNVDAAHEMLLAVDPRSPREVTLLADVRAYLEALNTAPDKSAISGPPEAGVSVPSDSDDPSSWPEVPLGDHAKYPPTERMAAVPPAVLEGRGLPGPAVGAAGDQREAFDTGDAPTQRIVKLEE